MATGTKNQQQEPEQVEGMPPVDASTDGWTVVQDESPTVVIFDTPGETFTGYYKGAEHIAPESAESVDDEFDRFRFTGLDEKPYAINSAYSLKRGLKDVTPGTLTRVTYVKPIDTGKGAALKDYKVETKA